jgi:hypothetical protein
MGGATVAIVFTNTGKQSCSLTGWPTITTPGLATKVLYQTTTGAGFVVPVATVILLPGQKGSSALDLFAAPGDTYGSCGRPGSWGVTPPGAGQPSEVAWPAGQGPCSHGTVLVSPVYLGSLPEVGFGSLDPTSVPILGPFSSPPSSLATGSPTVAPQGDGPQQPGPLAVGPSGTLYLADDALNEVLARASNGTFMVIAGDGTAGFAGDGGAATAAQLNQPQGLAVAADGTVYVADQGNDRVRAIRPDGTIHTVFSGGINVDAVAIGPGGSIYIATLNGILEQHLNGTVTTVVADTQLAGHDPSFSDQAGCGPNAFAFDAVGDLYVGCSNTHSLVERTSAGAVIYRGEFRPHDASAALVELPTGEVVGCNGDQVLDVSGRTASPVISFSANIAGIGPFWPQGITAGPDGTLYLSQDGVSGIGPPAIISVRPQHTVTTLWTAQ